jgi:hypothetical protein
MNTVARPMILLVAVVAVALLGVTAAALPQQKPPKRLIRLYVFTQVAKLGDFVGFDQKPRLDSVKDLRYELGLRNLTVQVVDTLEQADVAIEVLGREQVEHGAVAVALPLYGGSAMAVATPSRKSFLTVRLTVPGRDYTTGIVGGGKYFGDAAFEAGRMIERWAKDNYDTLVQKEEKK